MNLLEKCSDGVRVIKVSLASIKSIEGCILKTRQRTIEIADESQNEVLRQLWHHRRAMNSLKLYHTRYSSSTGCHYARIAPDFWQHVDCNDEIKRPIGDYYLTKENLLADHVPFLLRNGMLKYYGIDFPSPKRLAQASGENAVWELRNPELGISATGNTAAICTSNFLKELRTEFGTTVFINQKPV